MKLRFIFLRHMGIFPQAIGFVVTYKLFMDSSLINFCFLKVNLLFFVFFFFFVQASYLFLWKVFLLFLISPLLLIVQTENIFHISAPKHF